MCRSCARAHVDILYLTNGGKTKKTNKQKKKNKKRIAFVVLQREYTLYH